MTYHQLASQDAQFLYAQNPSGLTHITVVMIYDPSTAPGGTVQYQDIVDHVESRLDTSPIFKRKLLRLPMDYDHPYWVDDEHFDLESHITNSCLSEPANWEQFCNDVARQHSKPMDMSRPLWDMNVVEGLGGVNGFPKGSYALITRLHHAAADGVSSTHLFAALSDLDAKGTLVVPLPKHKPEAGDKPGGSLILRRAWLNNVSAPLKMASTFFRYAPELAASARQSIKDRLGNAHEKTLIPDTRFNAALTPHRIFDAVEFKLEDIIGFRKLAEGATVNDVILTIAGGALRIYLQKHKELPDESLIATVPINMRTSKGDDKNPGNKITAMQVKVGTQIEDAGERLSYIQKITTDLKEKQGGLAARVVSDLGANAPGMTLSAGARLMSKPQFAPRVNNLFVSNVAGPKFPLYMNGAKAIRQYGMAPLSAGMGLFLATPSYNGYVTFNITSDRSIMPDIGFFRDCIVQSFESLSAVAPMPKKKRKTSKSTQK